MDLDWESKFEHRDPKIGLKNFRGEMFRAAGTHNRQTGVSQVKNP